MNFRPPASAFAPFYDVAVSLSGTRRGRTFEMVVNCCLFDGGEFPEYEADSPAPSRLRTWTANIPIRAWTDETPPKVDDSAEFVPPGRTLAVNCRVAAVTEQIGDYVLILKERK